MVVFGSGGPHNPPPTLPLLSPRLSSCAHAGSLLPMGRHDGSSVGRWLAPYYGVASRLAIVTSDAPMHGLAVSLSPLYWPIDTSPPRYRGRSQRYMVAK
jgi:hypothetical protein